jgi:hypothetical protein
LVFPSRREGHGPFFFLKIAIDLAEFPTREGDKSFGVAGQEGLIHMRDLELTLEITRGGKLDEISIAFFVLR